MNLVLIYVNYVGVDHKGDHIYEFLFSDSTKDVDGEGWDEYPAKGRPEPPHLIFIKKPTILKSNKLVLDVIQNSDTFAVWDAVDGLIALAWENVNEYVEYPSPRLCFHFGDSIEDVKNKLYEKDLVLEEENEKQKK